MWYLLEDFFDQSLVMKALLGWGWLCVIIMIASLGSAWLPVLWTMLTGDGAAAAAPAAAGH
jgi:hypothetical protein